MSGLIARFVPQLGMQTLTQAGLVACYVLGMVVAFRFIAVCYKKGQWPDPSWFPALLLPLMGYITSQAHGPAFLRAPEQFLVFLPVMILLVMTVTYRIVLSPTRESVLPNAGMALFMAPCSHFCMTYLVTGKPFGDLLGLALFCCSTTWFMMTLWLLYSRRKLWVSAFHPSYVAFTFPSVSTATAALLASERLPQIAGLNARAWAGLLGVVTFSVVMMVFVRYFAFLRQEIAKAKKD